jgi:hypothetical protein
LLPDGVQQWFVGLGEAQKEGLSWDEAWEWLEAEGCGAALRQWHEAVEQSLPGAPKPPAATAH